MICTHDKQSYNNCSLTLPQVKKCKVDNSIYSVTKHNQSQFTANIQHAENNITKIDAKLVLAIHRHMLSFGNDSLLVDTLPSNDDIVDKELWLQKCQRNPYFNKHININKLEQLRKNHPSSIKFCQILNILEDPDDQGITEVCAFLCDSKQSTTMPKIFALIYVEIDKFILNQNNDLIPTDKLITHNLAEISQLASSLIMHLKNLSIKKHEAWYEEDSEKYHEFFRGILNLAISQVSDLTQALQHTDENNNLTNLLNKYCESANTTNKQIKGLGKIEFQDTFTNNFITPSVVDIIINNESTVLDAISPHKADDASIEIGTDILSQTVPAVGYTFLSVKNKNFSLLTQQTIGLQKKIILFLLKLTHKHNQKSENQKIYLSPKYIKLLKNFLNIRRGNIFNLTT